MNFIFSAGYYNRTYDANIDIAMTIAIELEHKGHECFVLLYSDETDRVFETTINGHKVYVLPIEKYRGNYRRLFRKQNHNKLVYSLLHPVSTLLFLMNMKNDFNECISYIKNMLKNDYYDGIIGFISPFDANYKILKNLYGVKKYIYQLDPWGFHESLDENFKEKRRKEEMKLFDMCSHVFTTKRLYCLYKKDYEYNKYINKITPLNFPGLEKNESKEEKNDSFLSADYTILYTGTIDDEYRNPKLIFELLIEIKKKYNAEIKVFLFGRFDLSPITKYYSQLYPGMFNICGEVDHFVVSRLINNSVFLLNINNNLKNQSPSKLINYISTGNAIINVIKTNEDPSIKTLANYAYSFNIDENDDPDYNELYAFLKRTKGKRIEFELLQSLYKEYTPEYIANTIIEKIKSGEDN